MHKEPGLWLLSIVTRTVTLAPAGHWPGGTIHSGCCLPGIFLSFLDLEDICTTLSTYVYFLYVQEWRQRMKLFLLSLSLLLYPVGSYLWLNEETIFFFNLLMFWKKKTRPYWVIWSTIILRCYFSTSFFCVYRNARTGTFLANFPFFFCF